MECDICLIDWDSKYNIPKILPCGHTVCLTCIKGIFNTCKKRNNNFLCPICKYNLSIKLKTEKDIENLLSNITLLNIVEKLENRRELLNNSKFFKILFIFITYKKNLK